MNAIQYWAKQWAIPEYAITQLAAMLSVGAYPSTVLAKTSEKELQDAIRREGRDKGVLLLRNNVGVLKDERGVPVRYGLANDSKAVNTHVKSGDLIGIRPVVIEPHHVGQTIGQFVSREVKRPGWVFNPNDEHEAAQMRWAILIQSKGGDALISDREGTL